MKMLNREVGGFLSSHMNQTVNPESFLKLLEELKQWVLDRLAKYKYPRWIEFISELPKSATGKTQRFKLR
jgi:acyl-coenzyme A synthetase/AMP-(fatty) acid ligase